MRWKTATVCASELGRRTVLFSEQEQKLIAVNDAGASLWRRLEAGLPLDGSTLSDEVRAATKRTLEDWALAGLIRPCDAFGEARQRAEARQPADGTTRRRTFDIGLVSIRLTLCRELSGGGVWQQFAHFPDCQRKPRVALSVRLCDARGEDPRPGRRPDPAKPTFGLWRERRLLRLCAEEEIVPAIRAQLTAELLEQSSYVLALHAAALCVGDRLMLVVGTSGSGKSTLAAALLATGYGLAADDLVLLDADGVARGIPFWPALKEGSWDLVHDGRGDDVVDHIHRRPDGRAVRYVPPGHRVSAARRPVGWVVVLTDSRGAPAELVPAHPTEALEALLAGAWAPGNRLTEEGFRALASMMGDASCFRLGRLAPRDAVAALCEACA